MSTCNDLAAAYAALLTSSKHCGQDYSARNPLVLEAYAGLVAYAPVRTATCMRANGTASSSSSSSSASSSSTTTTSTAAAANTTLSASTASAPDSYCFIDAVTNTSAPTSSYIYYLPLGAALAPGSSPACTPCLQATMAGYLAAAANASQPLSQTYAAAAARVNAVCGAGFAAQAPAVAGSTTSFAPPAAASGRAMIAAAVAAALSATYLV